MNMPASPAERLRQTTWPLHHRLDHHPTLAPLLAPGLKADTYRTVLAQLYPAQQALEAALSQASHLLPPHYDLAPRLADLESDLITLGLRPPPAWPPFAAAKDLPGLIGQLYVQEGARLGATHIERLLVERAPDLPRTYFSKAGGSARWPQFLALSQALHSEEEIERACQEASRVFRMFLEHLDTAVDTHGGIDQPATDGEMTRDAPVTAASAAHGLRSR